MDAVAEIQRVATGQRRVRVVARGDAFSRSSLQRRGDDDDETLRWAALERLPTCDRVRSAVLPLDDGGGATVVDVLGLGPRERRALLERLVRVADEDNERFRLKLKERIERVGIELPTCSGFGILLIALVSESDGLRLICFPWSSSQAAPTVPPPSDRASVPPVLSDFSRRASASRCSTTCATSLGGLPWSDSNSTSRAINCQPSDQNPQIPLPFVHSLGGGGDCRFLGLEARAAAPSSTPHPTPPMARPTFPVAPHDFFRRLPIAPHEFFLQLPAAPHEMSKASANEELRLSDLEQICHLGAGASGVVTKVRHRRTGAVFALKTANYPDRDTEDPEAEALRRSAGSPHVVRCHAVLGGPDEDVLAYMLELMDAGTLGGVLGRRGGRGLPEPALAEVAARCLEGLAHLHSRGVAHLDMNPNNLLVNSQGDVKIGDFSESKIFFDRAGEGRRVSIAVGMTAYKSPERFMPNAHAGPRGAAAADVWGFGVTVLELFLGRRPFFPSSEYPPYEKLRRAICDAEPPSVPESSAASVELRGFVEACLQKDPRRRATVPQLLAHPFVARRHVEESRRALRELIVETLE